MNRLVLKIFTNMVLPTMFAVFLMVCSESLGVKQNNGSMVKDCTSKQAKIFMGKINMRSGFEQVIANLEESNLEYDLYDQTELKDKRVIGWEGMKKQFLIIFEFDTNTSFISRLELITIAIGHNDKVSDLSCQVIYST